MKTPVWLFDLDNTLHDTGALIFPVIDRAMTDYIATHLQIGREAANAMRVEYWQRYGATMLGLQRKHDIDPHHFLHHTHQFEDLASLIVFDHKVRDMLRRLPGRKIVVSNGPHAYVHAVLSHMKILGLFERVCGVEQLGLYPKPQLRGFRHLLHRLRIPATRCILVEDSLDNLRAAHRLGMRTVWISRLRGKPDCVTLKLRHARELVRARRVLHVRA